MLCGGYRKGRKTARCLPKRNGVGNPTRTALWAQECTEAALAAGTKVRHWGQSPEKVGCKRGAIGSTARGRRIARRRTKARRAFSSLGADRIHAPPVSPFSGDGPAVFAPGVYLLFLRRRHTSLTCRKRLGINISQEENAYEETHRFSAAGIGDGTEPGTHHRVGSRGPRRPGSGHRGKTRPTQRPTALPGMARWWTSGWTWFPGPP